MKKALLIVCLFISVIASAQNNFFWSHNSSGGYGLLYNWHAATSTDKITSSDDWVVPSTTEWNYLIDYVGGSTIAGGELKQIGFVYWTTSNTGATNDVNFSARGAGARSSFGTGAFSSIKQSTTYVTSISVSTDLCHVYSITSSSIQLVKTSNANKKQGMSIRLVRDASPSELLLSDGTYCDEYIANNLVHHRTVKIGNYVWLAENLKETQFRSGAAIPYVTDGTTWIGLTTPAWCVYDNNFKYR